MRTWRYTRAVILLIALLWPAWIGIPQTQALGPAAEGTHQDADAPTQTPVPLQPMVVPSIKNDLSPLLATLPVIPAEKAPKLREIPMFALPQGVETKPGSAAVGPDPVVQSQPGQPNMPAPLANFEGVNNVNGIYPPDTQGDIGYDPGTGNKYYVQWVNLAFAIWDVTHTPTQVYGPAAGNTLWQGFGGLCETNNDGDPITLFDPLAQRWLMSQFALTSSGPYYQCIAVSQNANPLGAWYRYAFQVHATKVNDYPKFGVWPDAYYMTVNQFTSSYAGAGVFAFDRVRMLQGLPTTFQYFDLASVNASYGGMLPADLDGPTPPPTGTPGIFAQAGPAGVFGASAALALWQFHVDWANPVNSTFGLSGQPNQVLPIASFSELCPNTRSCIPQPGTTQGLDAITDRLMYRLAYRNMGGYQALVVNHTVDAGSGRAGVRWYEAHNTGSVWSLYQQGTFAPADTEHRWMGSVAMDHVGNLALGYSVSSGTVYPSIRYTGRLAGDALGQMTQGETTLIAGSGAQTGSGARWGDYSMLGVDPLDDCTFWYTQEYVQTTGMANWQTRIGSFRFPSCTTGPRGTLKGTVRDAANVGIAGAAIQTTGSNNLSVSSTSDTRGAYTLTLPVATYTVTASAYGYLPATVHNVVVLSGTTTTQDFRLTVSPKYVLSGVVRDAVAGWPLYARIELDNYAGGPIWSHPVTGYYSATLVGGIPYVLTARAWVEGYQPLTHTLDILSGNRAENLSFQVDPQVCSAPGYHSNGVYYANFEADSGGLVPGGTNSSWAWGTPTSGPISAHSGSKAWATNLSGNYNNDENSTLTSPLVDLSAYAGQPINFSWWQWLQTESCCDVASVEFSKDGGTTWVAAYTAQGDVDLAWAQHTLTLDASYAVSNLRFRLRLVADFSVDNPGWYIDDIVIGPGSSIRCAPLPGGLVVGVTYDAYTRLPLNGALVTNDSGRATTTRPAAGTMISDGYYTIFSPSGSHTFTATQPLYGPSVTTVSVVQSNTVWVGYLLPAGRLSVAPAGLRADLDMGTRITFPMTLTNAGRQGASYQLLPFDQGRTLLGPFQKPAYVVKPFKQGFRTSEGLTIAPLPTAPPYAAGAVLQSWPSGLPLAWGVAYANSAVWVSSPAASWRGNDTLYQYLPNGTATGRSWPHTLPHVDGPADLAYNQRTGMLWVMNVNAASNCIYELDPMGGYTGRRICPGGGNGLAVSQRGLAYDPDSDTWFAGSWNDSMIHHFDSDGTLLDEVNVGLPISGLAYNPDTRHLFAMVNSASTTVYVLNASNYYTQVGQFSVAGLSSLGGAGLELDCSGNLWAADQVSQRIYQFSSGEATTLCARRVPWISTMPTSGAVPGYGGARSAQVTLDASVPQVNQPGTYRAQIRVEHSTPYMVASVPVTLNVRVPANWGKLMGAVHTLGACDSRPAPLAGATVLITDRTGVTLTLATDSSGAYANWFLRSRSPLTLTFAAPAHVPFTRGGVWIGNNVTTTVNASLRWLKPCLNVQPTSLSAIVRPGMSVTLPLTLTNNGAGVMTFGLDEAGGDKYGPLPIGAPASSGAVPQPAYAETGIPFGKPVLGSSGAPAPAGIGSAWQTMSPLPAGRVFNAVIAAGPYVYVIGGTSDAGAILPVTTTYRYDTATNTWATMASLPAALSQIDGVAIGNRIYIPGATPDNNTYVYDIILDSWSVIAANNGYAAPTQYQVVVLGNNLYVLGGIINNASTTAVWILDTLSGLWSAGVPMQKSRTAFAAGAISSRIYVAGGVDFPGFAPDMTTEEFDGTSWTYVANVPDGGGVYTRWSYNAAAVGTDGLWLAGGRRDAGWAVLNHAGVYNPDAATWSTSPALPMLNQGRVYMGGDVAEDGYLYVIGGRDSAGSTLHAANERLYVGIPQHDVPWLSASPLSGTVSAGTVQSVALTFDASVVTTTGRYLATLTVRNDDPIAPRYVVPVTMEVRLPRLYLDPALRPVNMGQILTIALRADTMGLAADTVDAYLNFDPSILQVVDAAGNPATSIALNPAVFGAASLNRVNNAIGRIDFSATRYSAGSPLRGDVLVATLRLHARAPTTGSALTLEHSHGRQSDLFLGGVSLNPTLLGTTIVSRGNMTLLGSVGIERRGSSGDPRWVTQLFRTVLTTTEGGIRVYETGTEHLLGTYTATTDASGRFTVTLDGLVGGTYDINVKGGDTLSRQKVRVALPASSVISLGTLLVGDCTGDDTVSGADISYMVPSYYLSQGQPGFRPYADINKDGVINGNDISALLPNFAQVGPLPVEATVHAPWRAAPPPIEPGATDVAQLALMPTVRGVCVGEVFTEALVLNLGTKTADTLDVNLAFDPALLELVDDAGLPVSALVLNPAAFDAAIINQVDHVAGRVALSAARFPPSPLLGGVLTVAILRFRVKAPFTDGEIALVREGARLSELYLAGERLYAELGSVSLNPINANRIALPLVMVPASR